MSNTRSKGEATLTNFTDNLERIGKNKPRRKSTKMADAGTAVPQHQDTEAEENNQPPNDNETEGTAAVTPTEQMYLKDGIEWGLEDEVIVECLKLKQYFRVDTLLVQAISGRVHLYTNDKVETFQTKFSFGSPRTLKLPAVLL